MSLNRGWARMGVGAAKAANARWGVQDVGRRVQGVGCMPQCESLLARLRMIATGFGKRCFPVLEGRSIHYPRDYRESSI